MIPVGNNHVINVTPQKIPVDPAVSSVKMSNLSSPSSSKFEIIWRNLCYHVEDTSCASICRRRSSSQHQVRAILKYLNGDFRSGQLTAIMGPSGSGKTTLLECIAGKKQKGVSGEVLCTGTNRIKLSFISQHDQLLSHLTVRESLLFASKLKNLDNEEDDQARRCGEMALDIVPDGKSSTLGYTIKSKPVKVVPDHQNIVRLLLEQLGLEKCSEVRVANCSGGQMKRLSIAQELVSKPNVLILDEPTSGLDSASCHQCVELLLKLTQQDVNNPIAIVSTIHQPSARVFSMFHKVYFLSIGGQCIFEGPPSALVPHLSSVGLACPPFNNPADFMTEIATGDYGMDCNYKLEDLTRATFNDTLIRKVIDGVHHHDGRHDAHNYHHQPISSMEKKLSRKQSYPIFLHTWLLFHRTMLSIIRDPVLTSLRLIAHIIVALFIGLLYGDRIGKASGCPPNSYDFNSFISIQNDLYQDIMSTSENIANLFFANMFVMFGAMMPTVLTFPLELNVFMKERSNGWYSCGIYYIAKTMADVPFQIFFPALYGTIIYFMHSQLWSLWRFSMFISLIILVALTAQSQGLLVSALFMDNATAAVFFAPILTVPTMLFGGFFVRIKTMPKFFVPMTYVSYIRYGFESLIAIIYGFGRCIGHPNAIVPQPSSNRTHSSLVNLVSVLFPQYYEDYDDIGDPERSIEGSNHTTSSHSSNSATILIENLFREMQSSNPFMSDIMATKNSTESYVLNQYEITDDTLYLNMGRLLICFLVLRIGAYLALLWKTNKRK